MMIRDNFQAAYWKMHRRKLYRTMNKANCRRWWHKHTNSVTLSLFRSFAIDRQIHIHTPTRARGLIQQLIYRSSHCASFYLSATFRLNRKLTATIRWIELAQCEWSVQMTHANVLNAIEILSIINCVRYFNEMDFFLIANRTETPQANRINWMRDMW